jgi:acetylornithine/succinyldiaminopimelate/putrescine aminotransferase
MTNLKWLRQALLGGAALSVLATGAQADELTALKAQLEALQSRVNQLETQPAPALPAGTKLLTVHRGARAAITSSGTSALQIGCRITRATRSP